MQLLTPGSTTSRRTLIRQLRQLPRSADDYFVTQYTDDGWIRGQTIFNDLAPNFTKDYSENIRNVHIPVISHEIGQYSVFPDFTEIDKYTGNLSPQNFIAIKNDMEKKGLLDLSEQYLNTTGKFAASLPIGNVLEARSGNGKLLFSSIDLYTDLELRPIARQLKYSLIEYMKSDAFSPVTETDFTSIKRLLTLD